MTIPPSLNIVAETFCVLRLVLSLAINSGRLPCRWSRIMSTYDLPQNYALQVIMHITDALNRRREAALESLDCLEAPGLGGFLGGLVE